MALELVNEGDFSGIKGVFVGQGDNPRFLGLKDLSGEVSGGTNRGKFMVGFDTRIQPAQVRVYFDLESELAITGTDKHYGLIMTKEICFDGLPIKPSVFSDAISFQDAYSGFVKNNLFENKPVSRAFAVDMFAPDLLMDKSITDPFYAYNAACYVQGVDPGDSFDLNSRNGFLARSPKPTTPNSPLCASLVAPIGIDIDIPFLSHIQNYMDHVYAEQIEPVAKFAMTDEEYSSGEVLNLILNATEEKIPLEEVIDMKVIGQYMLVVLDDPEDYFPVLIADTSNGNIYTFEIDLLDQMTFENNADFFRDFNDFRLDNGRHGTLFPHAFFFDESSWAERNVRRMVTGGPHTLSCNYRIYAVSKVTTMGIGTETTNYNYNCYNGIEFTVERKFDASFLTFDNLVVSHVGPLPLRQITDFNLEMFSMKSGENTGEAMPELAAYNAALGRALSRNSDQIQWFFTYPPLSGDVVKIK